MNKKLFFFIALFFILSTCYAQKNVIRGYIEDEKSRERLNGAIIYEELSQNGAFSNEYGFFSLPSSLDSARLYIQYVGYSPYQIQVRTDTFLTIRLTPSEVDTVQIVSEQNIAQREGISTIEIPIEQIKKMPTFLGETDIIKAVQLLPGVKFGSEGNTGLYVRGGSPDQNLILLDGVPLYYISHLGGLFSIFNADAVSNVSLIKGGFPARYGGRLSSVLDIKMKEGNLQNYHAAFSLGLIAAKISVEGPIWKDKTAFIISARKSLYDVYTAPLGKDRGATALGFYDVNAKINHIFSQKDRLFLSYYSGKDAMNLNYKDSYTYQNITKTDKIRNLLNWGNDLFAIRWNHLFSSKLFSNVVLTHTNYQFIAGSEFESNSKNGNETTQIKAKQIYHSGIKDFAAKWELDYYPFLRHHFRFGTNYIYHRFSPGAYQLTQEDSIKRDSVFGNKFIYSSENQLYIEDNWTLNEYIKFNLGVHSAFYNVGKKNYFSFQPRLSLHILLNSFTSIKASYAEMSQFLHLLSNTGSGLPTDLWVPVTEKVAPQKAKQFTLGFSRVLKQGLEFSIESYYKQMKDLIEYKEGADFANSTEDWQQKIETKGRGYAYGIEILLQKKQGKTCGWIGYTLSWNKRQFENINEGKIYPYRYDRRHDISIVCTHEFNTHFQVGMTWIYGTGEAITLPIGKFAAWTETNNLFPYNSSPNSAIYGKRNDIRMAAYHRLDLNANFKKMKQWKWGKGERIWSISVFNAYYHKNPYMYFFRRETSANNSTDFQVKLYKASLFPILPSLSYSVKF